MDHRTLPEHQLITEIAVGIGRRLTKILGPSSKEISETIGLGYVWHMYTFAFERGCDVLWKLGVAYAAYGPESHRKDFTLQNVELEKTWPPYFRFLDATHIREKLSKEIPVSAPSLDEVLKAYLRVSCDNGPVGSLLSCDRKPFLPQAEYEREISLLEKCGYLMKNDSLVIWAEKIAPTMQKVYLWELDGRPSEIVRQEAIVEECNSLIENTPEATQRILKCEARHLSELDFAVLLRDRFDGLYLKKNPEGAVRTEQTNPLVIKEIYRKLRSNTE